jgi:hypothetical protein
MGDGFVQVLALSVSEQIMAVWEELSRLGLEDDAIAAMVSPSPPQAQLSHPILPPPTDGQADILRHGPLLIKLLLYKRSRLLLDQSTPLPLLPEGAKKQVHADWERVLLESMAVWLWWRIGRMGKDHGYGEKIGRIVQHPWEHRLRTQWIRTSKPIP